MSQPVVVARERPDYAFAVAPKGPFSGIFRDAHKETEMDVCVLALDRLRCPEESRDALIDYASRKFPREKERIGFMDEVICVAERIAGFAPGEAYRKRGVLKKMLGDSARYEEDWYNSAEKYLTMLHNDGDIARFTEKQLLKFLKDTTDSRGVIGTYVDVLFRHYGKGPARAVAHLTRPELFAAAGAMKAICVTGSEAVEAYLNAVARCDSTVPGGEEEFLRLTSSGCFDMMRRVGSEGGRFERYFAGRPRRYFSSEKYEEICTELFSLYAKGEDVSAALNRAIKC